MVLKPLNYLAKYITLRYTNLMQNQFNLAALTKGIIPSLRHISEASIEKILGGPIRSGSHGSPIFDSKGVVVKDLQGRDLCPSYTHISAFNDHIITQSGQSPQTLLDVKNLPLAYWGAATVLLISADDIVMLALRGNASQNAPGKTLHTASGYLSVSAQGPYKAELPLEGMIRELKEETDLDFDSIASGNAIYLGPTQDWPLSGQNFLFNEKVHTGLTPVFDNVFTLKSHYTAADLVEEIHSNHESIGFVGIRLGDFSRLYADNTSEVRATYWPSNVLDLLPDVRKIIVDDISISDIQRALANPECPKLKKSEEKYSLNRGMNITMTADTFVFNGNNQAMHLIQKSFNAYKPAAHLGFSEFSMK